MLAKESGIQDFGLAEEVLQVLPADPFEQLDVARKITSIALSTRISAIEAEAADLRNQLSEKDELISQLRSEVDTYGSVISNLESQLNSSSETNLEKENLLKENAALQNIVRKLNRDVAKLEVFKKTLMQSLQEDDESSAGGGAPQLIAKLSSNSSLSSPVSQTGGVHLSSEDEVTLPPSRYSSVQSRVSDMENSGIEDQESEASRPRISHGLLLASQNTTPRFTPPGSPPRLSPTSSMPVSPRRHSMSFSTSRGLEDRSSVYSSMSSSRHGSVSSTDSGVAGRTRVDGKEFFRQVRSRLSYEQFGAFLANVKELNAHKQTREETLRKADEIFGTENKDLYVVFEGLITRNVAH